MVTGVTWPGVTAAQQNMGVLTLIIGASGEGDLQAVELSVV